jgi:hypothetical protein
MSRPQSIVDTRSHNQDSQSDSGPTSPQNRDCNKENEPGPTLQNQASSNPHCNPSDKKTYFHQRSHTKLVERCETELVQNSDTFVNSSSDRLRQVSHDIEVFLHYINDPFRLHQCNLSGLHVISNYILGYRNALTLLQKEDPELYCVLPAYLNEDKTKISEFQIAGTGTVEEREHEKVACIREMEEELGMTGVIHDNVSVIGPTKDFHVYAVSVTRSTRSFSDRPVLMSTSTKFRKVVFLALIKKMTDILGRYRIPPVGGGDPAGEAVVIMKVRNLISILEKL